MNYYILRDAIRIILTFIEYAILANVIISWLPVPRHNALVRLVYGITEPILTPIRNMLHKTKAGQGMMIDFSPLVALLVIWLIRSLV